jgi:hypothetical protein
MKNDAPVNMYSVCIGMFFDFIFINKIIVLMLFIGSYYRTIKIKLLRKILSFSHQKLS